MLATWMSFDDTERLVVAALTAPVVGHSIVYGMSRQRHHLVGQHQRAPHRLPAAGQLGRFRAAVEARQPTLDASDPA